MEMKRYDELSTGLLAKLLDGAAGLDGALSNNVLEISTGSGKYVINRQPFRKEIWVSSPVSGPHHFRYVDGVWRDGQKELLSLLGKELPLTFS